MWRHESEGAGASLMSATVRLNPPFTNVPDLQAAVHDHGYSNHHLKNIARESKAKKVELALGADAPSVERQPSGYTPTPEALASRELHITASAEALDNARERCEAHLKMPPEDARLVGERPPRPASRAARAGARVAGEQPRRADLADRRSGKEGEEAPQ